MGEVYLFKRHCDEVIKAFHHTVVVICIMKGKKFSNGTYGQNFVSFNQKSLISEFIVVAEKDKILLN